MFFQKVRKEQAGSVQSASNKVEINFLKKKGRRSVERQEGAFEITQKTFTEIVKVPNHRKKQNSDIALSNGQNNQKSADLENFLFNDQPFQATLNFWDSRQVKDIQQTLANQGYAKPYPEYSFSDTQPSQVVSHYQGHPDQSRCTTGLLTQSVLGGPFQLSMLQPSAGDTDTLPQPPLSNTRSTTESHNMQPHNYILELPSIEDAALAQYIGSANQPLQMEEGLTANDAQNQNWMLAAQINMQGALKHGEDPFEEMFNPHMFI
ncbi:hypothetical protein FGO68_gene12332 [Halteria grandinella]|uniref:Uncharacterized protein n=1 Tax=Halteria grandinella TaxID=5974 RepID=A0A8J8T4N2_HALGN|nr:hypothetical protein FGO68_gene12332 [Halteria grandinella]